MSRARGAEFERRAAAYLERRGLRVVDKNFACRGGELDLVCDDGGTLVFVEVRARADDRFGAPEETVRPLKRRRLVRAARHYLMVRRAWDRPCRFDVVAIEGTEIRHYPNAFQVDG